MAETTGNWRERLQRALKQVGIGRLLVTFVCLGLSLYVARFAWDLPLASDAERALYDLRFDREATRTLAQNEQIVLVTYNDDTLRDLGKRSPLDRAMLARALTAIDGMGARAIGIDILIDQAQPEDPELIQAFRQMRTPTYLALATARYNPDQMLPWQEDFLRSLLRQVSSAPVRAASIRLQPDLADGVIRRWPDQPDDLPPLLANAMAPNIHPEFRDFRRGIDSVSYTHLTLPTTERV